MTADTSKKTPLRRDKDVACGPCRQIRFQMIALILIVLAIVGSVVLLRRQSVLNAETRESLAQVAALVNQLAARESRETVQRAKSQMANPASELCLAKGGTVLMAERPELGQYGVCSWSETKMCEEWALLRGNCPVGGVEVPVTATPEERYCSITGNEVMSGEKCRVGGVLCDIKEFYSGVCPPKE